MDAPELQVGNPTLINPIVRCDINVAIAAENSGLDDCDFRFR
jgi:hypothetical protein